MMTLKRILVPTDFSEFSNVALRYGCELAHRFEAELHVMNVFWYPLSDYANDSGFGEVKSYEEHEEAARDAARTELHNVQTTPLEQGQVHFASRTGAPMVEIIRYAAENDIDLIVMGTHGRTGLVHALMGSVAEKVVRKAGGPVLTVRHPEHEFVMP